VRAGFPVIRKQKVKYANEEKGFLKRLLSQKRKLGLGSGSERTE